MYAPTTFTNYRVLSHMRYPIMQTDLEFHACELRTRILEANYKYYDLNEPEIPDHEYDALLRELKDLEEKYPQLRTPDSPTQRVGGTYSNNLGKINHPSRMYSLDNIFNIKDMETYAQYIRNKGYNPETLDWYCDIKLDGISLELCYEHGDLVQASTRGNGDIGEDITDNVKRCIKNIHHHYPKLEHVERVYLRGEAIIKPFALARINSSLIDSGNKPYANSRNAVAGILRRTADRLEYDDTIVQFYCYGTSDMGVNNQFGWKTHVEMMYYLNSLGIPIVPYWIIARGIGNVQKYMDDIHKERNGIHHPIDGVVFRINDFTIQNDFGYTDKYPKFAMAYKFPPDTVVGIVKDIVYQIGKSGVITPIAQLRSPVQCNGVMITKATLHNEAYIQTKDIRVGDDVVVERAGDVIPHIARVCTRDDPSLPVYEPLFRCPCCSARVVREEGGKKLYCTNTLCPDRVKAQCTFIVGKACLNICGIGPAAINELHKRGHLHTFVDVFRLTADALMSIGMNSRANADMYIKQLDEKKKGMSLETLLIAMCIPNIGKVAAREIAKCFNKLSELEAATYITLDDIPGVGKAARTSIMEYFLDHSGISKELSSCGIKVA